MIIKTTKSPCLLPSCSGQCSKQCKVTAESEFKQCFSLLKCRKFCVRVQTVLQSVFGHNFYTVYLCRLLAASVQLPLEVFFARAGSNPILSNFFFFVMTRPVEVYSARAGSNPMLSNFYFFENLILRRCAPAVRVSPNAFCCDDTVATLTQTSGMIAVGIEPGDYVSGSEYNTSKYKQRTYLASHC